MIEGLLDKIGDLAPHWFLLLAFFLPFGETVALLDAVVPGEVGLVLLGAAAGQADVPLPAVIAVAAVGAFLGDSTSWYIGHRWGTVLLFRWDIVRRHIEGPLARAETHFAEYGGQTVFTARFVGALRAVVPLVAGTSGMSYRRFVPWNVAASIIWVSVVVILGAIFGEAVAATIDRFGIIITAIVVVAVVVLVIRRRVRRRQGTADSDRDDP